MFRTPVCCTTYTSPSYLWLQYRWDGGQELRDLTLTTTRYAASQQANQSAEFHIRDLVLARPNNQGLWYRGRVIGAQTAGCWPVRLIDFGECIFVGGANLLSMPKMPLQPMGFAVLCKLARIGASTTCSREAERNAKLLSSLVTMATEDLVLEAEFDWTAYTSEEEPIPVELYQRSGQSINDTYGQRTNTLLSRRVQPHAAMGFIMGMRMPPPALVERPVNKSWQPFEGRISHVKNDGTVFVQWDEKQLNGLQDQLQLFFVSEGMTRFSSHCLPAKDEIFAVFQEKSGYHYRGRLLETKQDGSASVMIIDFGFDLTVDWNQCAQIPSRIRYDPQCRAFQPINMDRVPLGTSLGALWKSLNRSQGAEEKSIKVTVSPNQEASGPELQVAKIDIHCDNRKVDIVDFLLGLEKKNDSSTTCYPTCQTNLQWDVDNIVCGTCTHVESSHVWYIQPTNNSIIEDTVSQVNTLITNLYASSQLDKPALDLMQHASASRPVAVLVDTGNGTRYMRGVVDMWNDTTQSCDLTYVDTGERASGVPLAKLFTAPEELINLPATCAKCKVASSEAKEAPKVGDKLIFSIVEIEEGIYKVALMRRN